jgi:hypothetical protein
MFEEIRPPLRSTNEDTPPDWPVLLTCAEAPEPGDPYSTNGWAVLVAVRGGLWREGAVWAWTWSSDTAVRRCQIETLGVVRWYHYDQQHLRKIARLAQQSQASDSRPDK